MNRGQRLRHLLMPRPGSRVLVGMGTFLAVMVCGCFFLLALVPLPDGSAASMTEAEMLVFIFCWVELPVLALFVVLAALVENRNPPRALLWSSATALFSLAGLIMTLMILTDVESDPFVFSTIILTTLVGPVVLLFSLPMVYFSARAIPEVRAALLDDLSQRACELIRARGEMTFAQLALALGISLDEVDNLLDELLRSGKLSGTMYSRWQRVYTTVALAEKQRFLLEWVRSQGRVYLPDLPAMLKTPRELAHDWLYQLVQRGQFSGYINWKQGWLYSVAAQKIGADSQCPQCGGSLSVGPALTVRCLHCGSEMLFGSK